MQLQRNEVLTGILVVATLAVLTGILVLLGAPGLFRPLTTYKIYFDNAAGIKLGAPVLLAGRKIGQVAKLYSPVSKEESERALEVAKSLHAADPNPTPAPEKPPRYEVRVDVQVDRSAQLYRDSRARMITLGLLGEVAIDFTEGTEASGRANSGEIFAGERVPDFGEAIARMLDIIAPVATEATATFKQLELTAENLSHITRSEEHTSELQSRQYLHSFPTRRSSDLFWAKLQLTSPKEPRHQAGLIPARSSLANEYRILAKLSPECLILSLQSRPRLLLPLSNWN